MSASIADYLGAVWPAGEVREVRIIDPRGAVTFGYFDDPAAAAVAITPHDGRANVYFTLNPVDRALLARAKNRLKPAGRRESTTSDRNVLRRSWLLVDIDPERPSGISATAAEAMAAVRVAQGIKDSLVWPQPLVSMSGNGVQMLYRIDLPNDAEATALVQGVLAGMQARFGVDGVKVDGSVFNAARIAGVIGTVKVKGDSTKERPHRRSEVMSMPDAIEVVPVEALRALLPVVADPIFTSGNGERMPTGWVADWLRRAGIAFREGKAEPDGTRWYEVESCPWHPDEDAYTCGPCEGVDGRAGYKCFHDRGTGMGWRDYRDAVGLRPPPKAEGARSGPAPGDDGQDDAQPDDAGGLPPFRRALDVLDEVSTTMDEWMVTDLLRPGRLGILAAYEGDGKSRIRTQVTFVVTDPKDGEPLFGLFDVPGPVAVAVVDMENGDREEARRDREMMEAIGADPAVVRDRYIRLTQDDASLSFADDSHVAHIGNAVDGLHEDTGLPVLLVLDSADSLHDGPLWGNDLSVVKNALRVIRHGRPWMFVLLVAHLNKRGTAGRVAGLERELEDVSGNLTRQADVVILLDSKGPTRMRMAVRKRVPHRSVILGRDDDGPVWTYVADAEATPGANSRVPQADMVGRMTDGAIYGVKDVMDWYGVKKDAARRALNAAVSAALLDSTPMEERGQFTTVLYWKKGTK